MIGWVLLDKSAVAAAALALEGEDRGVRDEVGFLALHQAVSDHLFPGTSVQHTRARYALLVPWLMQRVSQGDARGAGERLKRAEADLIAQLLNGPDGEIEGSGIIGRRVYRRTRRAPTLPPSAAYWSALGTWGILAPDARGLSRLDVLKRLAAHARVRGRGGDDPVPDDELAAPFVELPPPPPELGCGGQPLGFAMPMAESKFLRRQLMTVQRPDGAPSLLARLAGAGTVPKDLWTEAVRQYADPRDRELIDLARCAASLAAIGRAIYAALVEEIRTHDGQRPSKLHAGNLDQVRDLHGASAAQLDVDALARSLSGLPAPLVALMTATVAWLQRGTRGPDALLPYYRRAEARKGTRARLPDTAAARNLRTEWVPPEVPPGPLTYRWPNVRNILTDVAP